MRTIRLNHGRGAFTLLELLCVMAVISILAALLLPALSQGRLQAKRASCINELRQVGLGFHAFAHDHDNQFPTAVPIDAGGSLEYVQRAYSLNGNSYFSYHHFQVLSNELATPRLLLCPEDSRSAAANFAALRNRNLSFFAGVAGDFGQPDSILAGDRNLTNDWQASATLLYWGPYQHLRWTKDLHNAKGNLLFADGRVERKTNPGLASATTSTAKPQALIRPTTPPPGTPSPALSDPGSGGASDASGGGGVASSSTFVMPRGKIKLGTPSYVSSPSGGNSVAPVPPPTGGVEPTTLTSVSAVRVSTGSAAPPPVIAPPPSEPAGILAAAPSRPAPAAAPSPASSRARGVIPLPEEDMAAMQAPVTWGAWLLLLLLMLLMLAAFVLWATARTHGSRRA